MRDSLWACIECIQFTFRDKQVHDTQIMEKNVYPVEYRNK